MDDLQATFGNDPENDYALTMEISRHDEVLAIVKLHGESLGVDFYSISEPVRIELDWLLAKLQEARRAILAGEAVEGAAYDKERTPTAA